MANMADRDNARFLAELEGHKRTLGRMRHVLGADQVGMIEGLIGKVEALGPPVDHAKAADDLVIVRPDAAPTDAPLVPITLSHEVRFEEIPPELEAEVRDYFTPERLERMTRDAVKAIYPSAPVPADAALCPTCGGRAGGPALSARCLWREHRNGEAAG
jgi:hypothetical protein